ncbi:MAG: DNA polymerase IV [Solobacterium sp.]|nr:DNA polymerase IV [Solobacterium sp.]
MGKRIIFHIDINHCYAQIEEMKHPQLRDVPMAVGGHEEKRHGIILAKNDLAKRGGVKTGESLREARSACPDLLIIPPAYDDYIYYTEQVKNIYREYSDTVESFGLDEAWVDYTDSQHLFGDPVVTARNIQERVLREIGLTVSVGVSWNKVFAKLGSDMKKPSGLTVITEENYRDIVWPLPVGDLLYVGPATQRKLHERALYTIGDLANYPEYYLRKNMGAAGTMIHAFANGLDPSPVALNSFRAPVKSVGNAMTMIHDTESAEEVRPVYFMLCESVASRLKDEGAEGNVVTVTMRSSDLNWYMHQKKLDAYTDVSSEILHSAMELVEKNYDFSMPLRAVGVTVSGLRGCRGGRQLSIFADEQAHDRSRLMDTAMDDIRSKYGFYTVRRACTAVDPALTGFNAKGDHTIHPIGYFQGRKMIL